jgi:ABC-type uncharacterized transport system ATPase subunit
VPKKWNFICDRRRV